MASQKISLTKMLVGREGMVVGFCDGDQAERRLEAMGIRAGKKIKKLSGMAWGPVTVQIGQTQVGIGRGMAEKVIVEIKE